MRRFFCRRRRIFRFSPGGALLAIDKSIQSPQFLCDWAETWKDDTRNQSAQSLGVRFFDSTKRRFEAAPSWNLRIDLQPTVCIRLSWNSNGWYQTLIRTIARSWIFRFPYRGLCGGAHLNRFTAYNFYAIELKLCRMIQDISPHNSSASDFFRFTLLGTVGARLLEPLNRFTV